MKIRSLFSGLLLVVTGVMLTGCRESSRGEVQGYVEGEFVYVASPVAGTLTHLAVARGQTVAAGDLLFELDPNPEGLQKQEADERLALARARLADLSKGSRPSEVAAIEARLAKARAARDLAQSEHQRRQGLFDAGNTDAISREELDRSTADLAVKQAEVQGVEAELETARLGARSDAIAAAKNEVEALQAKAGQAAWQLSQKKVLAPAVGQVQDTIYRPGEFVASGRPVVSLLPPENLKIRFYVPQARLPGIEMGRAVQVRLDGLEQPFTARVSYISSEAEFTPPVIYSKQSRAKLVFMLEAVPDAAVLSQLRPGQPLDVFLD